MKRIIALLLASLFILAGCETTPKTEPRSDFPGEKYATYYSLEYNNSHLEPDEYDPRYNIVSKQPYFQIPPNVYPVDNLGGDYAFTFDGTDYAGDVFGYGSDLEFNINMLNPYIRLHKVFTLPYDHVNPVTPDWLAAEIWLDTGEVRKIIYDEGRQIGGEISEDILKEQANQIASKYIDVNKYEIIVEDWRVTYQQKFGGLYLEDPFYIQFGAGENGEPLVNVINLGRNGFFESLDYDPETVKTAIKAKAEAVVADGAAVTDISLDGIDIAKFGVPVVCSTVTLKWNVDGSVQEVSFYTKISD